MHFRVSLCCPTNDEWNFFFFFFKYCRTNLIGKEHNSFFFLKVMLFDKGFHSCFTFGEKKLLCYVHHLKFHLVSLLSNMLKGEQSDITAQRGSIACSCSSSISTKCCYKVSHRLRRRWPFRFDDFAEAMKIELQYNMEAICSILDPPQKMHLKENKVVTNA